jgi:hypothetical protein
MFWTLDVAGWRLTTDDQRMLRTPCFDVPITPMHAYAHVSHIHCNMVT